MSNRDVEPVPFRPAPAWALPVLLFFAIAVKAAFNLNYFRLHGYPSSPGGDIWFFAGVAQGTHHLFPADPLQWILRPLGACDPRTLYMLLLVLSNLLSLLSLLLLVLALRRFLRDEPAAILSGALYVCLSKSVIFATGSFHHQQEALVFIMASLWAAARMTGETDPRRLRRWRVVAAVFVALGFCVGPDMPVAIAALLPCAAVALARKFAPSLSVPWRAATVLLACLAALMALRPALFELATHAAGATRGIDLAAQRALQVEDLLPLSLEAMTRSGEGRLGLAVLVVGALLSVWALSRGRLPGVSLFLGGVLFSTLAVRFFFVAEIGLAWLFAEWFHAARERRLWWPVAAALAVAMASGLHLWNRLPCAYPSGLLVALEELRRDPRPDKKVFCTPTYGFCVEAYGRARATSDFHHLDHQWVEAAARPAWDAVAYFKVRGVTHLLLTSLDLDLPGHADPLGRRLPWRSCSGGFEGHIPRMGDEDLTRSLVYRVLTEDRSMPGVKVVATSTDRAAGIKTVLVGIE